MFGRADTYQVVPASPGSSRWEVIRGFQTLSTHDTKSAAETKARQIATEGDKLTIRRSDESIQETVTIQ
jgi:hypothetical protein